VFHLSVQTAERPQEGGQLRIRHRIERLARKLTIRQSKALPLQEKKVNFSNPQRI
jgi:hypothetical protein